MDSIGKDKNNFRWKYFTMNWKNFMIQLKNSTHSLYMTCILLLCKYLSLQVTMISTNFTIMVNYKYKSINGGTYDLRLHDHNRKR